MDDLRELLDPDLFRRWLEGQAGIVGTARNRARCPLARYLTQQTGRSVRVDRDCAIADDEVSATPLPAWAKAFVASVDAGG